MPPVIKGLNRCTFLCSVLIVKKWGTRHSKSQEKRCILSLFSHVLLCTDDVLLVFIVVSALLSAAVAVAVSVPYLALQAPSFEADTAQE